MVKLKMNESKQVSLDILNSLGQVIESRKGGKMQELNWTFGTEKMRAGLYFLRINTVEGSYTSKIQVVK